METAKLIQELKAQGYVAKTLVRGGGMYSNEPIIQTELLDKTWNTIASSLCAGDGLAQFQNKPLLKEIHINHPALQDCYRGTEIIRYLCKAM